MEFDTATGDVLIGVEFEVGLVPPNETHTRHANVVVESHPELFIVPEKKMNTYGYEVNAPVLNGEEADNSNPFGYYGYIDDGKWGIKIEHPMGSEFNFAHPLPFREFLPRMEALLTWFAGWQEIGGKVQTGADYGMHIHVNVKPDKGACVTREQFCTAYFADNCAHQTRWFDLQQRKSRAGVHGRRLTRASEVPTGQTKRHAVAETQFGSFELRHWDSTTEWDLLVARNDALGELIRDGLAVSA